MPGIQRVRRHSHDRCESQDIVTVIKKFSRGKRFSPTTFSKKDFILVYLKKSRYSAAARANLI